MALENNPNLQDKLEKLSTEEINYRYEQEEKMIAAVARGDFEEYQEITKLPEAPPNFELQVKRFQHDPLRNRGNGGITKVALNCGYSSSSYFSKIFKKYTGVAPSNFIKNITA